MKTLRLILRAVGMAAHSVQPAFRFGKIFLLLGGMLTSSTAASPPTDWHPVLPSRVLPFSSSGMDVAHGNGTFVTAGRGPGAVAISPDGLSWTPVLPGTFDYIESVAFGGGSFVAVGSGGTITSTDGLHWDHHPNIGESVALYEIRFLGGLFVATGEERLADGKNAGVLYTSINGLQWVRRLHLVPPGGWDSVHLSLAHGNGRFVVVGSEAKWDADATTQAFSYTSSDGIQWTRGDSNPLLSAPVDVAFGDAGFVLLDAKRILTSSDGIIWHLRHDLETSWVWPEGGMASSGNRIVCLAEQLSGQVDAPRLALSSEDGVTWQQSPLPGNVRHVFSDGVTFFALGLTSALTSSDGITWTERFTPDPLDSSAAALWDVAYGDHGFVAVGSQGTILASGDGTAWEHRASGTAVRLSDVIHGGGRYVAAGENGTLIQSTDGRTWTAADLDNVTLSVGPLAHGAGRFVAITRSNSNGFFWTSEDGMTWELRFSDALLFFNGADSMAFGNGRFVVMGGDKFVAVSEDGISWERAVLPDPYKHSWFRTLLFDGDRFLAHRHGFGQALLISPDGISWTTLDAPAESDILRGIGYGDGNLVAVRGTQANDWDPVISLLESWDGSSWMTVAPFQFGDFLEFAYGAGRFVGVGRDWPNKAAIIISGYTPPILVPQIDLRRDNARLMLRVRGAAGSSWNLQYSSTLSEWQTLRPVILGTEPLEIEVTPELETHGFLRLAEPSK